MRAAGDDDGGVSGKGLLVCLGQRNPNRLHMVLGDDSEKLVEFGAATIDERHVRLHWSNLERLLPTGDKTVVAFHADAVEILINREKPFEGEAVPLEEFTTVVEVDANSAVEIVTAVVSRKMRWGDVPMRAVVMTVDRFLMEVVDS